MSFVPSSFFFGNNNDVMITNMVSGARLPIFKFSSHPELDGWPWASYLTFLCFGHLMQIVDSLEKTLMLGGIGDRRKRGRQRIWDDWMASPTRWMWVWVNSGSWWWIRRPGVLRFMGSQRVGHNWVNELTDWCWKKKKYIYLTGYCVE